ncbi:MAG: sigma 54-interacting transcriptional regulator [Bryobacteraceae bacterium]
MERLARVARARLEAVAGPVEGRCFPLSEVFTVGRAKDNTLALDDRSVSRRHCSITPTPAGFRITDQGSANLTKVNGVTVFDRMLTDGDEIEVGLSRFLFVEEEPEHVTVVETNDLKLEATATLRIANATPPRATPALETLLSLAQTLTAMDSLEELAGVILEAVLKLVPAENAFLLTTTPDGSEVRRRFSASVRAKASTHTISNSILRQVASDRAAVEFSVGAGAAPSESIVIAKLASVAAAPILTGDRIDGILYLDRTLGRFDSSDLQILVALAGLAAGPIAARNRLADLEAETRRLRAEIALQHNMVGNSSQIESVYRFIGRVAPTDSTVLVHGESGTGKELVARAIHSNSPRARGPFVAVNCAALSETLLESELFGHEKGAFTGAIAQRKGKLEEAAGGTFFLDEVGEMPLTIQAKLLRVLQEREFQRLGSNKVIRADVRLVAATNRDLGEASQNKEFRSDLYYRLKVVSITMPPLRERRDDIEPLVRHFIRKHSERVKRPVAGITAKALDCLRRYDWPGNVRELENAVERAVVLGLTPEIEPEDFPEIVAESSTPVPSAAREGDYHAQVHEAKRDIVRRALAATPTLADAARNLGLHPNNLHRLVTNLGLRDK